MKKLIRKISIIFIFLMLLALISCMEDQITVEFSIIGEWTELQRGFGYNFQENGKVIRTPPYSVEWNWQEEEREYNSGIPAKFLIMESGNGSLTYVMRYSANGDTLYLDGLLGFDLTLIRD